VGFWPNPVPEMVIDALCVTLGALMPETTGAADASAGASNKT
jgi:hypothetical protein